MHIDINVYVFIKCAKSRRYRIQQDQSRISTVLRLSFDLFVTNSARFVRDKIGINSRELILIVIIININSNAPGDKGRETSQ